MASITPVNTSVSKAKVYLRQVEDFHPVLTLPPVIAQMCGSLADIDFDVELTGILARRNGRWAKTVKDGRLALIEDFVRVECLCGDES
jgi:hypothetical protein